MVKSPNTDKSICIPGRGWGPEEKFREVRHLAKDEEVSRHLKTRRDKREEKKPKYKIDDKIVLTRGYQKRHYFLIEVIDYDPIQHYYYGVLRNTTDLEYFEKMLGHLMCFSDSHWYSGMEILNVPPESIKWQRN